MVFVHGLAKVAAFLRVPPFGVGIAMLALNARRVDVAAVLRTTSPSAIVCFLCPICLLSHCLLSYHLGVFSIAKVRIIGLGVLFVQNTSTAGHLVGQEGTALLDNGGSVRGERN